MEKNIAILEELIALAKGGIVPNPHAGICENLELLGFEFPYLYVFVNCCSWKHYSGDSLYPIPYKSGEGVLYYQEMWVDDKLEHRISLIEHFIKEEQQGSIKYE